MYLMHKQWTYETLFAFLSLIKTLHFCIASEESAARIFTDYKKTIFLMDNMISSDACRLLQMRIFKHLGSLNPEFFQNDKILKYMYDNISHTPLERILKVQPLKTEHKNIIEKSNLFSLSTFL